MRETRPSVWSELKRRRVVRVGVAYVLAGVAVGGAADVFLRGLGAPDSALQAVLAVVVLGLPVALALSWVYDLTPEGIVKDALRPDDKPVADVEPPTAVGTTDHRKSIVVLPFDNLSPDPGAGYFGDGLTDEVISDLSKLGGLRVISRHSTMRLRGTTKDASTIAKDLGVSHVLTGSVRRVGDALRITAELAEGATASLIWSEKYTGTMADVFDLQETLARQIAQALEVVVTPGEEARLSTRPITNLRAYEAYLLARQECYSYSLDRLPLAERYLDQATEEEGETAWVLAARSLVAIFRDNLTTQRDPAVLREALAFARRALELDPFNAAAYTHLGVAQVHLPDQYREAIHNFRRALELDPNGRDATMWLGVIYANVGCSRDAEPLSRAASRLDPLSPLPAACETWVEMLSGRVDESYDSWDRVLSRFPDERVAWFVAVMMVFPRQGRLREMADLTEKIMQHDPDSPFSQLALFMKHAAHGDRTSALAVATPALHRWARGDWQFSLHAAEGYALIGENERALEMLESAMPVGLINYPFLAEYDEFLQPLWEQPGGRALLAQVKHEWESFEV